MPVDRRQFKASDRAYFEAFDRWTLRGPPPPLFRSLQSPAEIALKKRRYRSVLREAFRSALVTVDLTRDWDRVHWDVFNKMQRAALYYRFTGDRRAVKPAVEALAALEQCRRRYWSFSSCIGVLDMDLRTAEVALSLAMMRDYMEGALDAAILRRMRRLMFDRILRPGLEAERHKTYPWMVSRANWRIILCGCMAIGAMRYADEFPDYREMVEYGLEAMLTCFATGDNAGGWNEGPGYWDYGLGYAVTFANILKTFTGGKVDLFTHPFLRKTGDFRLFMHTRPDELWNWSDAGKKTGPSGTLMGLARAYQNKAYQWMATAQGVKSIGLLAAYDPFLKPKPPPRQPVRRYFPGLGVLVWREGFGLRDAYLGVKAGDIPHFNHHCHMDFGNLVIHAHGRELLGELDHWSYPYEGRKDPKVKGYQPGYYDIENKRWMRWDFDNVAAVGHNIVTLEGHLPQAAIGLKARFLKQADGPGWEAAIVDSTCAYRPLANRVRRYVVYLRPDIVVLVDEVRARQPVHGRVQFHPAATMTFESDEFTFANGRAMLRGVSLYPRVADHLVIGMEHRKTNYQPPAGIVEKNNRYVYIENLCRKPRLVFVTALQFGARGFNRAAYDLAGKPAVDDNFEVAVRRGRVVAQVAFDLARARVGVTIRRGAG